MGWMEVIGEAIRYIEENITEELTVESVAKKVNFSPFYFQKGFSMLCGFTIGEYIRNRRLVLAASELATGDEKVIDIALKYGYDSPDSFTKAFTRFHGVSPSQVRRNDVTLKTFVPLKIKIELEGGYLMDYRIEKKEAFTVIANAATFPYEGAMQAVPNFWQEHYRCGKGNVVMGMFGINIDNSVSSCGEKLCETGDMRKSGEGCFEYLIADTYIEGREVPEGFITRTIPAFTWAVFPCKGAMPKALQDVNKKIFSEWLPALGDYEFVAGYCVEMYEDPGKFPGGTSDENYYSEIWIPVKRK